MYLAHPPPTGRCWFTHSLVPISPWHTDYSHSHSDPQTTSIITQTHRHRLHQFLYIFTDYSTLTNTHLLPLYSHRLLSFPSDTQTIPILTQTHRLLPFSLRHKNFSHSHTDYSHSTQKHRLLPFSLTHTQTDRYPILTYRLVSFYLRHTDYSHSHTDTLPTPNQSYCINYCTRPIPHPLAGAD